MSTRADQYAVKEEAAEFIVDEERVKNHHLVAHEELPEWLKDNDHLLFGHRKPLYSFKKCIATIFQIHTETGNIWTHIIGMVLFVVIAVYSLYSRISTWPGLDIAMYSLYLFAITTCCTFSWMYHAFNCHSQSVCMCFHKFDYSGITISITGIAVSMCYFMFYCKPVVRLVYISTLCALILASGIIAMHRRFFAPKYRALRAGIFVFTTSSGIVPVLHFVILEGIPFIMNEGFFWFMLVSVVVYLLAVLCYTTRIPERFYPGKFDIMGQSHQMFHIGIVIASFSMFCALDVISRTRVSQGCA